MTYDPESGLHLLPPDPHLERRKHRLNELGLTPSVVSFFDEDAVALGEAAEVPYAMVSFHTELQTFFGLLTPSGEGDAPAVGREMSRDHGYCPDVLDRKKALVLSDVCAYAHFSGNPVVDQIGIRTYAGLPLLDERSGLALGTLCFLDRETRPKELADMSLALIKEHREKVMTKIYAHAPRSAR